MRRGEIWSFVGKGDFSSKPRPGLIVQSDLFNPHHPSVTACLISSTLTGDYLFRVAVAHDAGNGLLEDSEIAIDKIQAVRIERLGKPIGIASDEVMAQVDNALRRWLDL